MEYKIISAREKTFCESKISLEKEVNKHLSNGWHLQGGVSVSTYEVGYSIYVYMSQAVIKATD